MKLRSSQLRAMATGASAFIVVSTGSPSPAVATSMQRGKAAYERQAYVVAAREFVPIAKGGDAAAQVYLGFMFQYGRGVPQNYTEAAYWFRRAAEQGNDTAQYALGLLYDKGFGVREDIVEADKWLNLAAAGAPARSQDYRARLRDAVTSKMTRGQIAESRRRALEWYPQPEIGSVRMGSRQSLLVK